MDKTPSSDGLDAFQIGNDTYAVLGLVALFKMLHISAGKIAAKRTELEATGSKFFAVSYRAGETGVRLVIVRAATTGTRVVLTNVRAAQAAINTARSDDGRVTCPDLYDFVRHVVSQRKRGRSILRPTLLTLQAASPSRSARPHIHP